MGGFHKVARNPPEGSIMTQKALIRRHQPNGYPSLAGPFISSFIHQLVSEGLLCAPSTLASLCSVAARMILSKWNETTLLKQPIPLVWINQGHAWSSSFLSLLLIQMHRPSLDLQIDKAHYHFRVFAFTVHPAWKPIPPRRWYGWLQVLAQMLAPQEDLS